MTRDEIVEDVIALLRQHQKGLRGYIGQEPYRGDFFKLFAAAFNAGMMRTEATDFLRADALGQIVPTRVPELARDKTFAELIVFWREWTYAWDRADELRS